MESRTFDYYFNNIDYSIPFCSDLNNPILLVNSITFKFVNFLYRTIKIYLITSDIV